jgi:hypothetical protein
MRVTYTIQVCNESRELYSLLNFLLKVKDSEDNIQVVVDSLHKTDKVQRVLYHFKESISVYERPFDNFHENSEFHTSKATGDYIFGIDADEMPQEALIKGLKKAIKETDADVIWIPRINIHPGMTSEFIKNMGFNVNENGWLNWPDFQGRIWKNTPEIYWTDELHTKLTGYKKPIGVGAVPQLALWHIKSMEKQESRWEDFKDLRAPDPVKNLYDDLM